MSVTIAREVLSLHDERVAVYSAWHESFRTFLLDEQELIYGLAVKKATESFQRINTRILELMKDCDAEMKDILGRLQRGEEQKLKHTVALQLLQKVHFIDDVRREKEEEELERADREGTSILHHHHHHHHAVPSTLAEKRMPRANEVYDAKASAEAKAIAAAVEEINDAIEELREVVYANGV